MSPHPRRAALLLPLLIAISLAAAACVASTASAASVIVSPLPGTPDVLPQSQISFLGASAGSLSGVSVVGSRSGAHSGRLRSYASAAGASFLPSKPFVPGEHVTVRARMGSGHSSVRLTTHFRIAEAQPTLSGEFPVTAGTPADVQSFKSQPEMHPPVVTVHRPAGAGSAPGYVFAAPFIGPGQWGPMIFDSAGNLVWFHQVPAGDDAADFQTQTFHGHSDLTWWQGRTIILGYGIGEDVIANSNYKTVAVVKAGNGMPTDEHEFTVLPDGSALVLGYMPVRTSLASAGGPAGGIALDCVLQRVDIHTGLVMWEWRSLGHVDVSQSYSKAPTSPNGYFDYFHINSAQMTADGNYVISARNTWGIYALNARTGRVAWQLGGKKSTFALGPGVAFSFQHNALLQPDGNLSLFDDEGAPPVKPPTRGELVHLDLKAKTATLVRSLVRSPEPLTTGSQGNTQSLPNGAYMVGWGGLPNFTEFDPEGHVVYDAQLPRGEFSYRVYREAWSGQPATPPAISASTSGAATTVYASWNGATTVGSWQLLTGSSASNLAPVATTPKTGFETAISAPRAAFYQVRALTPAGATLASSAAVAPTSG